MNKFIIPTIFALLLSSFNVRAEEFDFSSYEPTLDKTFASGDSNINSGHILGFTSGIASNYDFIYYTLNSDNTTTSSYYKINTATNPGKNGIDLSKISTNQLGNNLEGYYNGLFAPDLPNINDRAINQQAGWAIGNITADFLGNYVSVPNSNIKGGAIYNPTSAQILGIKGDFVNNYIEDSSTYSGGANGGAIYNTGDITNGITGNFINNHINSTTTQNVSGATYSHSKGGAIYTEGTIGDINGSFINNYIDSKSLTNGGGNSANASAIGGAINNTNGTIGNIKGDFIGNHTKTYAYSVSNYYATSDSLGGAIYNNGTIGNIEGNFVGNYTSSFVQLGFQSTASAGGAIYNAGNLDVKGDFIENHSFSDSNTGVASSLAQGGAVYNKGIANLSGKFVNNLAHSTNNNAMGGAIYNSGNSEIYGSFVTLSSPPLTSDNYWHLSEAIAITTVKDSLFVGNKALSDNEKAYGGAIYNSSAITKNLFPHNAWDQSDYDWQLDNLENSGYYTKTEPLIEDILKASLVINNSSFMNNSVESTTEAKGGAIWSDTYVNITADNYGSLFSGNKANSDYNAIYMGALNLTGQICDANYNCSNDLGSFSNLLSLESKNNGTITFDDTIDGDDGYDIAITGDGTGSVIMNNQIINAGKISVNNSTLKFREATNGKGAFGTATSNLSLNDAAFDIHNNYLETVSLASYTTSGNSFLHIDVDPDLMTADVLSVSGDVVGTTKLVVQASSNTDIRGAGEILFAESFNDTIGSSSSFSIFRVYGSPYLYDVIYDDLGGNSHTWSLAMNGNRNPNYGMVSVASEIIGYVGLHTASIEQNRSMVQNIQNKIADNKVYCPGCGIYDIAYNGAPLYNVWVSPVYHNASIKKPQDMDINIHGLEGGFDIQYNSHHKIGIFASYRKGKYDLSGKGKVYQSLVKGEIDIDSYNGGLYYRYDKNNFWTFATIYGGLQKANLSTKDGVKTDTRGNQLGTSLDVGYLFPLKNKYNIEPNIGIYHTRVSFNNITDKYGKTAKYSIFDYIEATAGFKIEKSLNLSNGLAKIYIKPSVVRSFTNGNNVTISGLGKANTYEEGTFGRIELGGMYGINQHFSIFGMANYTFGSNYNALSSNIGLNYAW